MTSDYDKEDEMSFGLDESYEAQAVSMGALARMATMRERIDLAVNA